MASKTKNSSKPTLQNTNTNTRKRVILWGLGIGLIVSALVYFFVFREAAPATDSSEEPVLTARKPLLALLSPSETGIDFQNQIVETAEQNVLAYINEYNGGGLAVADFNNDKLPDLYFICTTGKNRLYLNEGNFKFKDITDAAGVASEDGFDTAVAAADVNADGWLDLFVCRAGLNKDGKRSAKLFINNGSANPLSFTEKSAEYGLNDTGPLTSAAFFDYDLDGDLDCYLLNHPTQLEAAHELRIKHASDGKTIVPDLDPKIPHDSDQFYRNDGGKFVNISKQAGIQNFGFGMSISITDVNTDGWPDIYIGNDFVQPDNLYINNQKGGFTEQISRYFRHSSMTTMGADWGDIDNDARMDLVALDMLPANNERQKSLITTNTLSRYISIVQHGYFPPVARNVLQRNNGNNTFSDIACLAGVYKTDWAWSCLFADLDNDGLKDLHISNGYRREVTNRDYTDFVQPAGLKAAKEKSNEVLGFIEKIPTYKVRNYVYQNKGNWQFEDKSGDWMTMKPSWSCGTIWADLDADGDLDMVVNNLEEPAFIYKNLGREQGGGNFLQTKLQGAPANPYAVGASVLIEYQGNTQYQEINPNRGVFSSVEHLIHFGLGTINQVDRLTVRWPDGKTQTLTNVPINQRLQLNWADASGYATHLAPTMKDTKPLFSEKEIGSMGIPFMHLENAFNDFETWLLVPWTLTDLGPILSRGDLNKDGLDDFFIGNSFDKPGAIYLQTPGGKFQASSVALMEAEKRYEDHEGHFFDADGDQDLDLFVLSGGSDANSELAWQCRLYLNDGKGNFSKSEQALPNFKELGLRTASFDYDGDGDLDLFIGGRLTPKNWPLTPRSVVLENNKGQFTDVTSQVGGDFERCGMVTDLEWSDLNGDGQQELVVVGEWMPVSVFQLKNKRLENVTAQFGLAKTNGFWNKLALADLDKDGDLDLVTGNLGLNTRFTASPEAPFYCYAKDFDNNGTLDPIAAYTEAGKIYPIMQKDLLVKQLPILKKKFLYSKDYAKATISDIWPQKDLDAALNLFIYDFSTCWWENKAGKFVRHALPNQVQASPVQGIVCEDFNGDGHMDLLMAGNKYGLEVETNPCDAGNGALLLGDGKGNFNWIDNTKSGFWAMTEARDMALLRGVGGKHVVIVANNNNRMQLFER